MAASRLFVSADAVRARFSAVLSQIYRREAPRYADLRELVESVNANALAQGEALAVRLGGAGELNGLSLERHGAIRLGTSEELSIIRRLFATMGLHPVGYYDLSAAGLPVHSTAFRPIGAEALRANPFRMFVSLLRLDLIEDEEARREASALIARRRIFTPRLLALLDRFETNKEIDESEVGEFVLQAAEIFRWRNEATASAELYDRLRQVHPLLADIACFQGPHVNHLTLRTLDIDAAQAAMRARGMNPKDEIEGPPRRKRDILLRQTSYKAIAEPIFFPKANGAGAAGTHAARFGEIEQRGVALTAKGRALYDRLLADARAADPAGGDAYMDALLQRFEAFPDNDQALCAEGLAFYHYAPTEEGLRQAGDLPASREAAALLRAGYLRIDPILYEDFLPVSAAGIFQSNLGESGRRVLAGEANRRAFEESLGATVLDELALYAEEEARSLAASLAALGLAPEETFARA
ncbi:2-oxoadipate dioxygenase/decarboxylase HglS [Methylocapsa acidiphila]|uniref:2-oxoadipate dioxygenase/decarboxylase HglS n=1 Tax=Methylocapsa acidiphila TaxID=133552 RepID=UPI000424A00E|nr:VOC family protein [Methylocapsa acidiphila]